MSYTFLGIDHVQLASPAGHEEKATAFYGNLLGMVPVPKPEKLAARGGVWFQCGPHQVHIGVQDDFIPALKAHPAFLMSDLKALRERLVQAGIEVRDDTSIPGVDRFHADDPFGNRLEFIQG